MGNKKSPIDKKSGYFRQVGETVDGKIVVSGVYKLYETEGLPLDIIFTLCIQKGWVPSWIDLYKECLAAGMSHNRILSKLEEAIQDSFGKEYAGEVISKLDSLFSFKEQL
jgi:hypothetical protein